MFVGVLLGGVLLAARMPGVFLATLASDLSTGEKRLTLVSMPRGMAAGVLATLPASAGVAGTEGLPPLVFSCVVTTIAVFAMGFPMARSRVELAAGWRLGRGRGLNVACWPFATLRGHS